MKLPVVTIESFGLAPPKMKHGFFVDYRKGEVGELRLLLRKMVAENKCFIALPGMGYDEDYLKRREILKRLIRCMTLGMDVSRLYTDVVMISYTKDPVQKKMIYMFLSTYSKENPDLTVLTINTLLKDVDSVDPVIRCLALRNLSAFETPLSNDYAKNAVLKKFHDPSDSVKRSAIIGSLRVYKSQCSLANKGHIVDFDPEAYRNEILPNVMSSFKSLNMDIMFDAMCVYSDMMEPNDEVQLTKSTVVYMINRIKQMSEWSQCLTLKLLQTYVPHGDELFDLLNLLDNLLRHNSSAVFLATAKCFLKWTMHDSMLQLEVIKRLEKPMIALLTQCCNEVSYNLLLNTLLLILNAPKLEIENDAAETSDLPFAKHYEIFYCLYDDPAYIKSVKLNILVAIACESNSLQIVNEIIEYISDTNHEIATKSVKAIGVIALRCPSRLDMIIQQLSSIFTPRIPYLISAVLYVICALLRAYKDDANKLLKIVEDAKEYVRDTQALSYYIWILGEFGSSIEQAPYILEEIIDKQERPDVIRELLCASMKVFFQRPPEMYPGLSRLFGKIMQESQNPELVNLASFYYSLLQKDIDVALEIISGINNPIPESTMENMMVDLGIVLPRDDWTEIFNSLDILEELNPTTKGYQRFFPFAYGDVETDVFAQGTSWQDSSDCDKDSTVGEQIPINDEALSALTSPHEKMFTEALQKRLTPFNLVHPTTLLSEEYQKNWSECNTTCQSADEATSGVDSLNTDQLEEMLLDVHIVTLASGNNQETTKIYQYAQDKEGRMYYIEVVVDPVEDGWSIKISVRTKIAEDSEQITQPLADAICYCIKTWLEDIEYH